jgi:hypothetical protein
VGAAGPRPTRWHVEWPGAAAQATGRTATAFNLNNLFSRFNFEAHIDAIIDDDPASGLTATYTSTTPSGSGCAATKAGSSRARTQDQDPIARRIARMDLDVLAARKSRTLTRCGSSPRAAGRRLPVPGPSRGQRSPADRPGSAGQAADRGRHLLAARHPTRGPDRASVQPADTSVWTLAWYRRELPSSFPPPDAWLRGSGRNWRGRRGTAEAVDRPFAHVTSDMGTRWG